MTRDPVFFGRVAPGVRPFALLGAALLGLAFPLWAGVTTSSHYAPSDRPAGTFGAANLIDGQLKSFWVEGKEASGIGESFTLDLPRAEIKKVLVFPGHGEDERMFKKWAHLKEVSLTFYSTDDKRETKAIKQVNFTFEDTFKWQEIPVEGVKVGEELFGGQVKLTILSVYPGVDFQDTAVAEVKVMLGEFAAQLDVSDAPPAAKGSSKDNLVDGAMGTAWIADAVAATASFTLTAPDFGLAALMVTSGGPPDAKDPKKARVYARPKDVSVEIAGITLKHTLADSLEPQRIELPVLQGYTGSVMGPVKLTVLSVYPGSSAQNLAIRELQLLATQYSL